MKKLITFLFFILLCIGSYAQDIVYDTLKGNPSAWMKVYGGTSKLHLKTYYENIGMLSKSKVVTAAGDLEGLTRGVDYQDYYYNYDMITTEFSTDTMINMVLYKYYTNDTAFNNYLGFRKPGISRDVFDGQYIFICPIIKPETVINVYEGIGSSKRLFRTFTLSDINESTYYDWDLDSEITVEASYLSKWMRFSRVDTNVPDDEKWDKIKVWPNPTQGILNISFPNPDNQTFIIRIYSLNVSLLYQGYLRSSSMIIDISSYASGSYYILFFDEYENLLRPINIIKI